MLQSSQPLVSRLFWLLTHLDRTLTVQPALKGSRELTNRVFYFSTASADLAWVCPVASVINK